MPFSFVLGGYKISAIFKVISIRLIFELDQKHPLFFTSKRTVLLIPLERRAN